jgi:hypothetical protein
MAKKLRNFGITIDGSGAKAALMKLAGEADAHGNWYPVAFNGAFANPGTFPFVHQAKVLVRLGKAPDGRPVCTGLVLGAFDEGEITARGLRDLPLVQFLIQIGRHQEVRDESGAFSKGFKRYTPKLRRGPQGLDDEHFKKIAGLYRTALKLQPRAPLNAMRELLGKGAYAPSDSTIHGWVRQARQRGFLGKAVIGKAGEKPKEKSK